jgi:hypothetical protein
MTWVLIILVLGGSYRPATTSVEFNSQATCNAARDGLQDKDGLHITLIAECFQK